MSEENLDFEIDIVTDAIFESEKEQLNSLCKTLDRVIYSGRIDLFNNTILKCIDNAEKQSVSTLLLIATYAKKIRSQVPLYKFLVAIIKDELEKNKYTQEKIDKIIFGLL